jgi:hypothetical protein
MEPAFQGIVECDVRCRIEPAGYDTERRTQHAVEVPFPRTRAIVVNVTTKDTPIGARRAIRRTFWAGPGARPAETPPPSSEHPVQLQEWNGRVWEDVVEAATQEEIKAFLEAGPAW